LQKARVFKPGLLLSALLLFSYLLYSWVQFRFWRLKSLDQAFKSFNPSLLEYIKSIHPSLLRHT
jgi:hypothetical protein